MKAGSGETLDSAVYPDLSILQKKRGYRFSLDPILLFGFISRRPSSPVIDLGCGSGVISLLLARRWPELKLVGLEIQHGLAEMARRSASINRLEDRVCIIRGDIRECSHVFRPGTFNAVVCNPPYRKPASGKLSPDPERAAARHELTMSLDDLLAATEHLLSPGGNFFITWKPERYEELTLKLRRRRLFLSEIRHVKSRDTSPPFLILCRGQSGKSSLMDCTVLPPLVVYEKADYSREVNGLLNKGIFPPY